MDNAPRLHVPKTSKHIVKQLRCAEPMWVKNDYLSRFPTARRGAKALGHRFERRVAASLSEAHPSFIDNLPFAINDYAGRRVVVPDGLLFTADTITLIEIKLTHNIRAFWEMLLTYKPVVEQAFNKPVRMLEICRNYDREAPFPVKTIIVSRLEDFITSKAPVGVLLWRG